MPHLLVEEAHQRVMQRGAPGPVQQRSQDVTRHLLLEEGDLFVEVQGVQLIVPEPLLFAKGTIHGRKGEWREMLRNKAPRAVDRRSFERSVHGLKLTSRVVAGRR
jgi:hypothetical protein